MRKPPVEDPLVDLAAADPRIQIELRYATDKNFIGSPLYPEARCLVRASVAARLSRVQDRLESEGYGLKVWDAYRPYSAQVRLWEIEPDPRHVADPRRGSRHNRGMAVDVTLVEGAGFELPMPTGFDDFTRAAEASYAEAGPVETANRELLIEAMEVEGFQVLSSEWWHFDAEGWERKPILDVPFDAIP